MNDFFEKEAVYIEWRGKKMLLAEGIDALLSYHEKEIILGASGQKLSVRGDNLEMKYLSDDRIAIVGTILAVSYV